MANNPGSPQPLTKSELAIFRKLNSPRKIQDFLNAIPINFEPEGDTCLSPRMALRERRCHCIEGAFLAAAALQFHGHQPLLVDLKTVPSDLEHVIAVFRQHRCWGAISKTNHSVLRYREPVYRSIRELVMSYFHEYTDTRGRKTLRSYSLPIDLSRFDKQNWVTAEGSLWDVYKHIDAVRHYPILSIRQIRTLRRTDRIEIRAGKLVDFKKR